MCGGGGFCLGISCVLPSVHMARAFFAVYYAQSMDCSDVLHGVRFKAEVFVRPLHTLHALLCMRHSPCTSAQPAAGQLNQALDAHVCVCVCVCVCVSVCSEMLEVLKREGITEGPKVKHLMEHTLQYEDDLEVRRPAKHYLGPQKYAEKMRQDRLVAEVRCKHHKTF